MKGSLPSRLFLSRLMLNPLSRQVMSEQAHPYEMHRTIMRGFPDQKPGSSLGAREEYGVLFRCEPDLDNNIVRVYVQSLIEPDWSFLESFDDYLSGNITRGIEYKDVMPAYKRIKKGQLLSFRLKANPTKRIADNNDPLKGKRVNFFRENEQIEWLMRKSKGNGSETGGFEIPSGSTNGDDKEAAYLRCVRARTDGKVRCLKKGDAGKVDGHVVTQYSVTYDGILRVTDPVSFIRTLIRGIGPGKAFGFGLLSIAPLGVFDKQ
mgnify:CR=1 FL=1